MTKQATLSVVPATNTAEAEQLSPSRQRLVQAYERRVAAMAAFEKATKEHQRVERLITDTKPIDDRIAELEAENSAFIEQWALSGSGATPKLPHTTEIDRLKAELHHAEAVAKGARTALARMNDELQACQQDSARAVEGIKSAADMVLLEIASEYADLLGPLEERAALLRVALKALQQHFNFEGARGRPIGPLANTVGSMIPRSPDPSSHSIEKLIGKWAAFASRLFTDEQSQMEL
jgi:DNA repair exonuclease SbcCD ATPase subunit